MFGNEVLKREGCFAAVRMKDPRMQQRVRLVLQASALPVWGALDTSASLAEMVISLLSRGIPFFHSERDFSTGACRYCKLCHHPHPGLVEGDEGENETERFWGISWCCSWYTDFWRAALWGNIERGQPATPKLLIGWKSPSLGGLGGEVNSIYC